MALHMIVMGIVVVIVLGVLLVRWLSQRER
jgi:hypothetical protein